jgi:maleamate amidohydrolase
MNALPAQGPPDRPGADGELAADYTSAGFGGALEWGTSPAVIVIDMVRAYFQPGAELYMGSRDCLESAARVVEAARTSRVPVLHTRVAYGPGGVDGGLFYRKVAALRHFAAGAGGGLGEIMPEVAPRPDELVVVKQYASAFFGTSLPATLAAARIDTLVICGVSTSGCVRATAVDAISHGYLPVVVRQAVGDRDSRPHEANLFDLQAKYAEVLDEDEVIERLKGRER